MALMVSMCQEITLYSIDALMQHPELHEQWKYFVLHSVWIAGFCGLHSHTVLVGRGFDRKCVVHTLNFDPGLCRSLVVEAVKKRDYCWTWVPTRDGMTRIFFVERLDPCSGQITLGPEIVLCSK